MSNIETLLSEINQTIGQNYESVDDYLRATDNPDMTITAESLEAAMSGDNAMTLDGVHVALTGFNLDSRPILNHSVFVDYLGQKTSAYVESLAEGQTTQKGGGPTLDDVEAILKARGDGLDDYRNKDNEVLIDNGFSMSMNEIEYAMQAEDGFTAEEMANAVSGLASPDELQKLSNFKYEYLQMEDTKRQMAAKVNQSPSDNNQPVVETEADKLRAELEVEVAKAQENNPDIPVSDNWLTNDLFSITSEDNSVEQLSFNIDDLPTLIENFSIIDLANMIVNGANAGDFAKLGEVLAKTTEPEKEAGAPEVVDSPVHPDSPTTDSPAGDNPDGKDDPAPAPKETEYKEGQVLLNKKVAGGFEMQVFTNDLASKENYYKNIISDIDNHLKKDGKTIADFTNEDGSITVAGKTVNDIKELSELAQLMGGKRTSDLLAGDFNDKDLEMLNKYHGQRVVVEFVGPGDVAPLKVDALYTLEEGKARTQEVAPLEKPAATSLPKVEPKINEADKLKNEMAIRQYESDLTAANNKQMAQSAAMFMAQNSALAGPNKGPFDKKDLKRLDGAAARVGGWENLMPLLEAVNNGQAPKNQVLQAGDKGPMSPEVAEIHEDFKKMRQGRMAPTPITLPTEPELVETSTKDPATSLPSGADKPLMTPAPTNDLSHLNSEELRMHLANAGVKEVIPANDIVVGGGGAARQTAAGMNGP